MANEARALRGRTYGSGKAECGKPEWEETALPDVALLINSKQRLLKNDKSVYPGPYHL